MKSVISQKQFFYIKNDIDFVILQIPFILLQKENHGYWFRQNSMTSQGRFCNVHVHVNRYGRLLFLLAYVKNSNRY